MEIVEKHDPTEPVTPALMVVRNPFVASEGREAFCAAFLPGETLGRYCERMGVALPSRVVNVWHNGRPVPLALWHLLIPRQGDQVVIRAKGEGGGGGGKVLRTVAMLALVIAAPQLGALAFGAGTIGAAALTSGIMIGGSLLINALLPPPTPTSAKLGQGQKYESSPTYSIQGGRNRKRPYEPMMLVFGRHKVVPDLAVDPYTEQAGDNQFLRQAFHFGLQGMDVSLTDLRIGSTPVEDYKDVQIQRSGANGKLSLIAGNPETIQGFALPQAEGWQTRTTGPDVYCLSVELASRLFRINDDGGIASRSVDIRIQYRRVGTSSWIEQGLIGAQFATHYWSLRWRDQQQTEYGSTNPADHTDGDTIPVTGGFYRWRWVPHPYQLGQPWQGIAPDPLRVPAQPGVRLTGARQEPTRRQVTWDVPIGQYEIRVMKVTADINTSRESNETAVSQIMAFQQDKADYTGQVRLAMRARATGQLNGAIDEFSAIASAQCLAWTGSAWAKQETSNPAWWYLFFARGKVEGGKRVYGGGLSDAEIDIESIKAWGAWCAAKKLTFDYVLTEKMSTAAVLQMIARAGRATLTYQTGKLGVIWDAENLPVSAMFGPFNVKAGSFKIAYTNDGTVDEIVGNFINSARGWILDEVRVKVPGATTTNNPLQLDFDGCVYEDMAGREANLLAAAQVWKRRRIQWETDVEGLVAVRGDVVSFSHDLTEWGYSGRLMPGSGGTTMKLQKKVPSAGFGTVLLRDPDGNMKTVSVVSAVGEVDELTIVSDLDGFPMPGDTGYEDCAVFDWAWQFDPLATPGRRFKITAVVPAGDGLRFEAVDDDLEYYKSESNPYQYTPPRDGALLGGTVFLITFAESIRSVAEDSIDLEIGWVLSVQTRASVTVSVNGAARPSVVTEERRITVTVKTGDVVTATVRPVMSSGAGQPRSQDYAVAGLLIDLPAVTGLTSVFRDGLTTLVWERVTDVRNPGYEVRIGPTWANARTVLVTSSLEALAVGNGLYFVAARFQYGAQVLYGEPDSLLVTGATLVRNVILVQDEAPDWSGSLEGGAYVYDGMLTLAPTGDFLSIADVFEEADVLWFGGPASSGTYTNAEADQVDIGYVSPVRVGFEVLMHARNVTADVLQVDDIFEVDDILNGSDLQKVRARPQIRHAQVTGDWSPWVDYVPGVINARYFDVRLIVETSDPMIIPFVTKFEWSIDVPDLVQQGSEIMVPTGGMRVTYPKPFHTDSASPQITIFDAVNGDWAKLTNTDRTGFNIQILNGNTPKAGVANWLTQAF
ncbi:bacteriophage lambda tail assembly protein I [Bordetella bronchiseptica OSU095]|uniref:host specificity factor TipJ family phage tail protein n=1 Tax=Bordetella bronchiseptica TaxID=518 RepID=UPI00049FD9AC|nr:host specificity factor TipJ family phage tail protein [Bordetella bronchiseptica]KDD44793.1 bacteriophage lambda tail assembly protein I [Bordetella bronchiseptica OSU095]